MSVQGITIAISEDKMQAKLTYAPVKQDISLTTLVSHIKTQGVVAGLKRDVLNIVLESIRNGRGLDNIVIAEGVEPFEGVQPSVDYKFSISSKPTVDESGKTNYRELNKIKNVKRDQLLAVKKRMKLPVNGITVTGEGTNFLPIIDIPLIAETNIRKDVQEDYSYFYASTDGALSFKNNKLSVYPELKIDEDVDFSVGNVHFKGDVKIGRDILPDFIVTCDGKLTVFGSAIACFITAVSDIDVRGGIVGKNKGDAKSKENIFATFVENAKLFAGRDIYVKNGIIGSDVYCDGDLVIENRKARIVGSTVRAARGIRTYNAGSRFDTSTRITTGIFPEKEKKFFEIQELFNKRVEEAKEIEKKYGRNTLENKTYRAGLTNQIKRAIKKWEILKDQIKQIHALLATTEQEMYDYSAEIIVKETLFPRVYLKIGKHELTTSREYYNVKVKFSEELDKLEIV